MKDHFYLSAVFYYMVNDCKGKVFNMLQLKKLFVIFIFFGLASLWAQVDWLWSGGVTTNRAVVVAGVQTNSKELVCLVSTSLDLTSPIRIKKNSRLAEGRTVRFELEGLTEDKQYYYGLEVDGKLDKNEKKIGSFKTFPSPGKKFTFALGACAASQRGAVWPLILQKKPLFFLFDGDFHYANPNGPNVTPHREAYEKKVFSGTAQQELLRQMSVAYIWDDHDYSGNDSDGSALGKLFARQAFREYVPHYELPAGTDGAVYQAFSVGRLRVIMTDVRSEREQGHVLSPTQRSWFEKEVKAAVAKRQMIAWVTSYAWNGTISDNWGGFTNERRELSDFFVSAKASNLMIFSGDSHMSAIDDGENCDFSSSKSGYRWPLFHAGGLFSKGSTKGVVANIMAPLQNVAYSNEKNPDQQRNGQYGTVSILDEGGPTIQIQFRAFRVHPVTSVEDEIGHYDFTRHL